MEGQQADLQAYVAQREEGRGGAEVGPAAPTTRALRASVGDRASSRHSDAKYDLYMPMAANGCVSRGAVGQCSGEVVVWQWGGGVGC